MPRVKLFSIAQTLRVFTSKTLAEIIHSLYPENYDNIHSARVQIDKWIKKEPSIEKVKRGVYRVKGCRSEGGEHSLKLSETLSELFKIPDTEPVIHREKKTPIGLIPDAMVMLSRDGKGACFILEEVNLEEESYLQGKVSDWRAWGKAPEYLSSLFQYHVPHFDIVISGTDFIPEGCYSFKFYMERIVKNG